MKIPKIIKVETLDYFQDAMGRYKYRGVIVKDAACYSYYFSKNGMTYLTYAPLFDDNGKAEFCLTKCLEAKTRTKRFWEVFK